MSVSNGIMQGGMRPFKCFRKDTSGATAVEFAMVAGPFFVLLLALIEVALVFFSTSALESATMDAARQIRTGQIQISGGGATDFRERVCDRFRLVGDCQQLRVDVRVFENFRTVDVGVPLNQDGTLDESDFRFEPGSSGDIVLVRVFYSRSLIMPSLNLSNMPGNKHMLTGVAVFRNEPFDN